MKKYSHYFLLFAYLVLAMFCAFYFDGTADSGDSITHYLFAKYAPFHPKLYFDHWAKPVFVLLASPFAQFGFIGVKMFNVLVSLFTVFFTIKIAEKLKLKNAVLAGFILIFAPLNFALTYSGLTDPLFALFLSIGIFAAISNKNWLSVIIISFLPFVRSEGLIFLGVFGFYFLIKKEYKLIPFLLFGHVIYSIAGYIVYHDILWVFTKIPYAHLSSLYGSGKLNHFAIQLLYVLGLPIYILFWVGLIAIAWKSIRKKISAEIFIFIFLGFIAFFTAHTLFWYFGIFNSMGLKRVMIGIIPIISIIVLIGFNFLTPEIFNTGNSLKKVLQALIIIVIFVFPLTQNPASLNWKRDLNLKQDQLIAQEVTNFIRQENISAKRFFYSHPYLAVTLEIDPFDTDKRVELTQNSLALLQKGDIIIWDSWFSVVQNDIPKEILYAREDLNEIYKSTAIDNGVLIEFVVMVKR